MRGDEPLLGFHPGPMDIPSEPRCLGSSRVDDAEILHFGGGQQAQSLIEGLPRVAPTLPSPKTTQHDEGAPLMMAATERSTARAETRSSARLQWPASRSISARRISKRCE